MKKKYHTYKKSTQEELNKFLLNRCIYADLEDIKYLLTSPKLKIHADIHTEGDLGFAHLIGNGEKAKPIMQYLIFDFKIDKTMFIEQILNYDDKHLSNGVKELIIECKKMFESRELMQSLDKSLVENSDVAKKVKI